jgi:DNA-directed RNA polymerase specialized sigma24 family protein
MRAGEVVRLQASGWTPRDQRHCDARLVRVLSFEQAFASLEDREQSALLLAYRDGLSARAVSAILREPVSATQARTAQARLSLANALDRRDLL